MVVVVVAMAARCLGKVGDLREAARAPLSQDRAPIQLPLDSGALCWDRSRVRWASGKSNGAKLRGMPT